MSEARRVSVLVPASRRDAVAGLADGAEVLVVDTAAGRRAALAAAAAEATGDVVVALAPTAVPQPGFLAPLVAAVDAGAGLVAPLVATAGGPVRGYRREPDGSLLPRFGPDDGPLDALSLDCLAAERAFFLERLPAFDVSDGLYESRVAGAAGSLAVAEGARVSRVSRGPAASVVVCTHDRADEVAACLDALAAAGANRDGSEIVVVANACSDATAELVRERAARHGGAIRLVEEHEPGLSRARNAGARAAAGGVLLYLDDDSRPAPGWLEAVRDAFADPSVSFVGGPIAGLWPEGRPAGFPGPRLQAFYSVLDRGDADRVDSPGNVYGANFAVRKAVLERCGDFDPAWGYVAGTAVVGEDSELLLRAHAMGAGATAYVAAAAVGHRIGAERVDEAWLARRVFRHGLVVPHVHAGFGEPAPELLRRLAQEAAAELAAKAPLAATASVRAALEAIHNDSRALDERMDAARALGVLARSLSLLGSDRCRIGEVELTVEPRDAEGLVELPRRRDGFRVLAIVPAHNEADVIEHTVGALIAEGIEVYLLDNRSTDGTADRVRHLLGHGLVHIERFPDDAGYPERDAFVLKDQLRRFAEIAAEQPHDWVLIADSDEFRESPFPGTTLGEAIRLVDRLGYGAIDYALFNFRPVDDSFVPGTDVREALTGYEPGAAYDAGQIKTWKNVPGAELADLFGTGAQFPGRRVFPLRFVLRHYPIRGETHGRRKVLRERLARFAAEERAGGWHHQYNAFAEGERPFLWDPASLTEWDGAAVRAHLLAEGMRDLLTALAVRGLDLAATPLDRPALGAWLGTGADVGQLAAQSAELAHRPAPERAAVAEAFEPSVRSLLRETSALLRAEAGLIGNPVERRAFGDLEQALAAPRTVMAFAADLLAEPELLARYCAAFDPAEPVTLAVVAAADEIEPLAALVPEESPDILAVAEPPAGGVVALYARRTRDGLDGLPRFDDSDLAALRRSLELPPRRAA